MVFNKKEYNAKNREKHKAYMKKWRKKHPNYMKEWEKDNLKRKEYMKKYSKGYQKKYREENKEKIAIWNKKSRIKNLKKYKARRLARTHKPIPKGQICIKCNEKLAVDKHHEDYNKPLEVMFVCKDCHIILDGEKRTWKK